MTKTELYYSIHGDWLWQTLAKTYSEDGVTPHLVWNRRANIEDQMHGDLGPFQDWYADEVYAMYMFGCDHDFETDSHCGPDTGYEEVHCDKCGYSFSHTYY